MLVNYLIRQWLRSSKIKDLSMIIFEIILDTLIRISSRSILDGTTSSLQSGRSTHQSFWTRLKILLMIFLDFIIIKSFCLKMLLNQSSMKIDIEITHLHH